MMDSWPLCRSCRRRERKVRKGEDEAEDVLQPLYSCLCPRITHRRLDNRGRRTLLQIGGLKESLCFSAHSSIATGPALMGISTKREDRKICRHSEWFAQITTVLPSSKRFTLEKKEFSFCFVLERNRGEHVLLTCPVANSFRGARFLPIKTLRRERAFQTSNHARQAFRS